MGDDVVIVGVVGKPFGVDGDVHVHPDADLEHDFPVGTVYDTERGELTVEATRLHGDRRLVRFGEAADRGAAEDLRGLALTLDRAALPLPEGAAWVEDVLGAEVVDEDGQVIGALERVLDTPAHDLLVVARPDGGEALIPAVEELVEIGRDRIVVRAIPGLLDADAAEDT